MEESNSSLGEEVKSDSLVPEMMESIKLDYPTIAATLEGSQAGRQPMDHYVEIGPPIPGPHVMYPIKGRDASGEFEVQRQYSDFFALHAYITARWPGVPIPPIPPKKLIVPFPQGNKSEEVTNYRRTLLQAFLRAVMQVPFVYQTDEFSVFLRTSGSFKTACNGMKRYTFVELAEIYRETFPEFANKPVTPAVLSSLEGDFQGLTRMISDFRQCSQVTSNLSFSFARLQMTYGHFAESLQEFETTGDSEFATESPRFKPWDHSARKNPFEILSTWFLLESSQIQSMLQVYDSRRRLQAMKEQLEAKKVKSEMTANKLRSGQNTFTGFITGKSKPAQIAAMELQIKQVDETIRALEFLCNVVTTLLHDREMVSFKRQKADLYASTMKRFGAVAAAEYTAVLATQMVATVAEMKAALPEVRAH